MSHMQTTQLRCRYIKVFVVTAIIVAVHSHANAQTQKLYTIQPGENIQDIVPKNKLYEYEQFQPGAVTFKNGVRSQATFNYNFVHESVQFISPKGDTFVIANPEEVKSVVIGKDEYYYALNRFVKLDTTIGSAKIGIAGFFTTVSRRKLSAYGSTVDGGVDSYGSYVIPTNTKLNLTPNVETTVAYRKAMFLGNRFNLFLPVTRKNIFSFYPDKERELKEYLAKTKVDFTSREDVIRLIGYMEKVNKRI
jgi:hypothetical protein